MNGFLREENMDRVMKKEPLVTIGLPTYNRANLLPKCIRSVVNQTYTNWELIILDDNSSDDTEQISKCMMKLDSRIKYFKQISKSFLPKNRNLICKNSNSDLIFFIEDDLILDHECVQHLVNAYCQLLENYKVGAVVPRMFNYFNEKSTDDQYENNDEVVKICHFTGLIHNYFNRDTKKIIPIPTGHSCSLISKGAWRNVGGYEENLYKGTNFREETDFYFRLRNAGYFIFFDPKALTHHYRSNYGGCRLSNQTKMNYYYARNHILFILKHYPFQFIFMMPLFIVHLLLRTIDISFKKIKNEKTVK